MELLDAFVFGRTDIADMPLTARLGRHTVVYGESLFFGSNGIAGGQAPVDAIKALSVPNTQFKELLMPVNQLSGQLQVSSNITFGAYYQFEWRKTRIPPAGSYFSTLDILDGGGERFLLAPGAPATAFFRGSDIKGSNSGHYGAQIRFRFPGGDT